MYNVTMEMTMKSKRCLIKLAKNKMDDWIYLSTMLAQDGR